MTQIRITKEEYIAEGIRRKKERIDKRIKKLIARQNAKNNPCTCGEDPYCYCGDGTPYSY